MKCLSCEQNFQTPFIGHIRLLQYACNDYNEIDNWFAHCQKLEQLQNNSGHLKAISINCLRDPAVI